MLHKAPFLFILRADLRPSNGRKTSLNLSVGSGRGFKHLQSNLNHRELITNLPDDLHADNPGRTRRKLAPDILQRSSHELLRTSDDFSLNW